jgi:hypothetical protein
MKRYIVLLVFVCNSQVFAQTKIFLFRDAKKEGISIAHLDSTYKSAVHANKELAVFKTPEEQQSLQKAYYSFIRSMASFLTKNNFVWDSPVRSYNRVYMNADGTVEYFIFQFGEQLSPEKETEFLRLARLYTKDNKFPITANERFAQCSPVQYGK